MDNATHLGLDVHKETIAVATPRPESRSPTSEPSRTHPRRYGRSSHGTARARHSLLATRPAPPATTLTGREANAVMSGPASARNSAAAGDSRSSCWITRSSWAWTSSAQGWAKGGPDQGRHHALGGLGHPGQQVPDEVGPARCQEAPERKAPIASAKPLSSEITRRMPDRPLATRSRRNAVLADLFHGPDYVEEFA
jgi:hypothetical protein